jgi:hypothetical protein
LDIVQTLGVKGKISDIDAQSDVMFKDSPENLAYDRLLNLLEKAGINIEENL